MIIRRPNVDRGAKRRVRERAVITLEEIFEHYLPIRPRPPFFSCVELERVELDAATCDCFDERSEERQHRRRIAVEIDEHKGAERLGSDWHQRVILEPKAGLAGRARRGFETAGKIVGPGVIAALHPVGVTAPLHDFVAAVTADIYKPVETPVVADDDNRHAAGSTSDIITRILKFGEWAEVIPRFAEDLRIFPLDDRCVSIPAGRK